MTFDIGEMKPEVKQDADTKAASELNREEDRARLNLLESEIVTLREGKSISERMHLTMIAVLATLCKGQPTVWPSYLKKCQRVLNGAVHDATGEQPHFLLFNRRLPRLIGVELPQLRQDADLEVALEVVKRTNIDQARKWRSRANIGRKNQKVVDQLVWVKKDYTTSVGDRMLGVKWVGPYKVKEVLRDGGAYRLENVFDGVRIQRAADKVKPYLGQEDVLVQPRELILRDESEEEGEVEPRPVRERRPPRRYGEDKDGVREDWKAWHST